MNKMFCQCESLEILNIYSFNTENVLDMSYMFYKCLSLKELNISNFKINKNANMNDIFTSCNSLKDLNKLKKFLGLKTDSCICI